MSDGPNSPEWLGKEISRHAEQIEALAKALPASEPQSKILGRCEDIRHYSEEATKAPALIIPHSPTGVCACAGCWPSASLTGAREAEVHVVYPEFHMITATYGSPVTWYPVDEADRRRDASRPEE